MRFHQFLRLAGAVLLWPLRFHFRVQAMRLGAARDSSIDLPQVRGENGETFSEI